MEPPRLRCWATICPAGGPATRRMGEAFRPGRDGSCCGQRRSVGVDEDDERQPIEQVLAGLPLPSAAGRLGTAGRHLTDSVADRAAGLWRVWPDAASHELNVLVEGLDLGEAAEAGGERAVKLDGSPLVGRHQPVRPYGERTGVRGLVGAVELHQGHTEIDLCGCAASWPADPAGLGRTLGDDLAGVFLGELAITDPGERAGRVADELGGVEHEVVLGMLRSRERGQFAGGGVDGAADLGAVAQPRPRSRLLNGELDAGAGAWGGELLALADQ